jgi:hypothetical protein
MMEFPDRVSERFYAELRERRLSTTRCRACGSLRFPPRAWCPDCLSEDLEWIALSGKGRVAAFSTQETAVRFRAPDVIGLVDLDEGVRVLSHVAGRYEDLSIGDRVSVDFFEPEPGLTLHRFLRA